MPVDSDLDCAGCSALPIPYAVSVGVALVAKSTGFRHAGSIDRLQRTVALSITPSTSVKIRSQISRTPHCGALSPMALNAVTWRET